ncbi:hypothetical protein BpHYR1_045975 [Brachionus plicatilis]|uniref:Uncharacterized protein n=1 Tax=Brachionus plicatilis TaxID=10195 RepID=A0A3M7T6W9_BRAPC|nr:hypothetical protein BpHYR1_045975 [Brachionus plicatilis]
MVSASAGFSAEYVYVAYNMYSTNVNITSGDEDKSPKRLIKVLLGGSNVYSACNGYLTSVS